MARWNHQPQPGTILHSDRGSVYTSWIFGHRLREAGLLGSMGRVASSVDNTMMESFWSTMQRELLDRQRWATRTTSPRPSSNGSKPGTTRTAATPASAATHPPTTKTFTTTPQPRHDQHNNRVLLAAKVACFSVVLAIVSVISCLASFLIRQALLSSKHAGVSLRAVLGGAAHLVLIGAIAVGVGALLRHTAAAVAALFAVLLIVPGLVTLLPSPWNDNVTKYLPSSAGVAMSAVVRFPNLLSPAEACSCCAVTLRSAG